MQLRRWLRRFVHPPFFVFVLLHYLQQIQLMALTSGKKQELTEQLIPGMIVGDCHVRRRHDALLLESQIARISTQKKANCTNVHPEKSAMQESAPRKKCTLVQLSRLMQTQHLHSNHAQKYLTFSSVL
jgi:hypothetical protein